MARPEGSRGYLAGGGTTADLARMDEAYCRRRAGPPKDNAPDIFCRLSPPQWTVLWGEPADEANRLQQLGLRGRIWAIILLLHRYEAVVGTASDAARMIFAFFRYDARIHAINQHRPATKRTITDEISNLISADCKDGFPRAPAAIIIVDLVIDFAVYALFDDLDDVCKREAGAKFADAARSDAVRPSELHARLLEVAAGYVDVKKVANRWRSRRLQSPDAARKEAGRGWKAEVSHIDPAIDQMMYDAEKRILPPDEEDLSDASVGAIEDALKSRARLIVVSGEPLLGKKTKVKGVLRRLAGNTGQLLLTLRSLGDDQLEQLPVLAVSASAQSYRKLIDKVSQWLEGYRQTGLSMQMLPPRTSVGRKTAAHFDEAVEDLFSEYNSLPALVVITDVEAFEFAPARHAIRDTGIRRLIEAILAGNRSSRVLITTTDQISKRQAEDYVRPRGAELISIPPPNTADLRMFVAEGSYDRLPEQLRSSETEIRGDDLVALASLSSLAYYSDPSADPFSDQELAQIEEFLRKDYAERDHARRPLYRSLIDRIAAWDLVKPIALIAASHDGVRDDSLARLLGRWNGEQADAGFDQPKPDPRLVRFQQVAGDRFLRRSTVPRYDADEYSPAETHGESDQVWDMDPNVAYWLLKMLAERDPDLASQSHRLIAGIARERAQNKKLRMRSTAGSRVTEDAPRDVQAYTSLLASIRLDAGQAHDLSGPPLRTCEEAMFSLDPSHFNPARALRFAAFCLLREDIDRDYRLSMFYDEDQLRVDLYSLMFLETGRQHPTKLERLELPHKLPPHFRAGIFQPNEVLEFMNTVALAAYHSQRFDALETIGTLADRYVDENGLESEVHRLARLWCCQLDAEILRGGSREGGGLEATITRLRAIQDRLFEGIGHQIDDLIDADPDQSRFKAYMRLLAREAELAALVEPAGEHAKACYELLDQLEARFSAVQDQHDPMVVNGRVARRYLRYLLSDGGLERQRCDGIDPVQTLKRVGGLLSVNTSRLRRFSGAERVGVLLDHARVELFQSIVAQNRGDIAAVTRHIRSAHAYAESAYKRAFSGAASQATRLDVLAVYSEASHQLAQGELEGQIPAGEFPGRALDAAGIAAHDLWNMAKGMNAKPAIGLARQLEARALILQERYRRAGMTISGKSDPRPLDTARRRLADASKTMAAIGDKSLDARIEQARASLDL